jgi:hypothetical protein
MFNIIFKLIKNIVPQPEPIQKYNNIIILKEIIIHKK